MRGLAGWGLLLALMSCSPGAPADYPVGYPLPKNGTVVAGGKAAELSYPEISATTLGETLLGALKATGWTVSFDGGLDPTAGRVISATKDGRTVFASIGVKGTGSILVVKEGPASK